MEKSVAHKQIQRILTNTERGGKVLHIKQIKFAQKQNVEKWCILSKVREKFYKFILVEKYCTQTNPREVLKNTE